MVRVLVTGASGTVGGAVAAALASAGCPVRLATRSGSATPGPLAEMVALDFTDPQTWPAAFAGVESMFLVRPPAIGNVKRDLLPAVAAAQELGVKHVVFLSLQGADRNPVVPHAAVEAWLQSSGMRWTFVRPSFFCQNLSTTHAADIRDRNQIIVPAGRGATAFVDAVDVGAIAAAALLDPGLHAGRAWTVTGSAALTYDEVAAVLSTELNRSIRYTQPGVLPYVYHARGTLKMSWAMVAVTSAIYTTARLGLAAELSESVNEVLGRDPVTFAEFAHRTRTAWIR